MSDTPETDALMDVWKVGKLLSVSVMLDHARKLERERDKAQKVLREISKLDTSQLAPDVQCSAIYLAMEALGEFK